MAASQYRALEVSTRAILLEYELKLEQEFDIDRVLELSAEAAIRASLAHAGIVYLLDYPSRQLIPDISRGEMPDAAFNLAPDLAHRAAQQQATVRGSGSSADPSDSSSAVSLMAVPLIQRNVLIGSIVFVLNGATEAGSARSQALERLAGLAAYAVARVRRLSAVSKISEATARSIESNRDLDSLLDRIVDVGFSFATISAVDDYRGIIETIRAHNVPAVWSHLAKHSLFSTDIQAFIVRTGKYEVIEGYDLRFDPDIYYRFEHDKVVRLFAPIRYAGKIVGTIEAGCPREQRSKLMSPANIAAVEALASEYAQKVAEARSFVTLQIIATQAIEVTAVESASIHVYDNENLILSAGAGLAEPDFIMRFQPRLSGLGRRAMETRQPQVVDDPVELEAKNPRLYQLGVRGIAAVPLSVETNIRGVLYLHHWEERGFEPYDLEMAQVLARQIEVAVENTILAAKVVELSEQASTMSRLQHVIQALASGSLLSDVLSNIAQNIMYMVGADNVTLYVLEENGEFKVPPVMKGHFRYPDAMRNMIKADDIVRQVLSSGRPRWISDAGNDPALARPRTDALQQPRFIERERIQSSAAVVLRTERGPVGLLFINYRRRVDFKPEDRRLIQAGATSAALAIEAARLRAGSSPDPFRHEHELAAMRAVDRAILEGGRDLQRILELILEEAQRIIEAPVGVIMLADADNEDLLVVRAARGLDHEQLKLCAGKAQGILGIVAAQRQAIIVPDVLDEAWKKDYRRIVPETRSEVAVPILDGERLVGVFNLEHPEPNKFTEEDRALLETLAVQMLIAIHTAKQYERYEREQRPRRALTLVASRIATAQELDLRLRFLLTGLTARQGLAFSRAMLFQLDETSKCLKGRVAVGAASRVEAEEDWAQVNALELQAPGEDAAFQDLLERAAHSTLSGPDGSDDDPQLSRAMRNWTIALNAGEGALANCCIRGEPELVAPKQVDPFRRLLSSVSNGTQHDDLPFLCVPLMDGRQAIGAIVLDNAFLASEAQPIQTSIELIQLFTQLATISIVEARKQQFDRWRTMLQRVGDVMTRRVSRLGEQLRSQEDSAWLAPARTAALTEFADLERLLQSCYRFATVSVRRMQDVDLCRMLQALAAGLRSRGGRPVVLTLFSPLVIRGDDLLLREAFEAILENADQSMREAHSLRPLISVKADRKRSSGAGFYAEIEITDTGPGVPVDRKGHIFEPLFTTRLNGTGLGLSFSRDIIEKHEGAILESGVEGRGARFEIRLPLIG
jgi:GAF domain-containing protein